MGLFGKSVKPPLACGTELGDRPDPAIALFGEVIMTNSKSSIAFFNRGRAYFQKGDYDRAITDYNEAIRLNLKNAASFATRGGAYAIKASTKKQLPISTRRSGLIQKI